MKIFTNSSITKKIVIVMLTILLLTFSIPKPVNADVGGVLVSPLVSLATLLADTGQYLLEWVILGRANYFMDQSIDWAKASTTSPDNAMIKIDKKIDGSFFGLDRANVPDICYTPEAIFSNRVPALDVNFISPSVKTGDSNWDNEHNIAIKLQPVISSWYVAMRTLALVGLLSVLVYLGIRMLLTGVAADRAKYKKMMMDWVVAICLLFALHFIMSFALTMSEVVASLISPSQEGTVSVYVAQENKVFDMTLMNYVRFMIQCTDFKEKIAFLALYIMLVIYTWKFTWTYLKRVVNMAFLTLVAPLVALTYPIDKVSDSKAQAFELWIKEFSFNALLQPLHLLLYVVLLGSATELAAINPLYAIVCLAFISAGEKLFRKMFGFDKAGAGTVGSLAGAAAVSTLAHSALMRLGRGSHGGKGGGNGKVRTNDKYQRQGKDNNANKGFNSFDKEGNQGLDQLASGNPPHSEENDNNPPPLGGNSNEPPQQPTLYDLEQERAELYNQGYTDESDEIKAINDRIQEGNFSQEEPPQEEPTPQGTPEEQEAIRNLGPEQPETWRSLRDADIQQKYEAKKQKRLDKIEARRLKRLDKESGELSRKRKIAAYKTWRGIKATAPAIGYKAAKLASRAALGTALGVTAGVIGATTGDGDTALKWAAGGLGVGAATGDDLFDATAGKAFKNRSVRDSYDAAKHGSVIDARNARADKAYLKSAEHAEEYDKYFKEGKLQMSREEYDKAVLSYRQAGITDTKTIRNALKLEYKYKKDTSHSHGSAEDIRGKVQNIAQTYDQVSKKAVYGEDKNATEAALKNIEGQLSSGDARQKRAIANEILQGYRDWYNI